VHAPRIEAVDDRAGLEAFARILIETLPESAFSADELAYNDETYPGAVRHLAMVDGEPVAAVGVTRIWVRPPDYDGLWCDLGVLPAFRGRGVGSALLRVASQTGRDRAKTALHVPVGGDRPDAIAWLERRGYREYCRSYRVALSLDNLERPALDPPAGVEITSLAERPDLVAQLYELMTLVVADVPAPDEPYDSGTLEEFRRSLDDPSSPADAYMLALEDEVLVGYAHLGLIDARPGHAIHWMTGVRSDRRGRGIARALKRAQIAWAKDHGLTELETDNDPANGPMRAVNARLGYRPRPDFIEMRGPVR
jgi:GNAT superfamily N-acetyltransferase